jgi:hypothetical protein
MQNDEQAIRQFVATWLDADQACRQHALHPAKATLDANREMRREPARRAVDLAA